MYIRHCPQINFTFQEDNDPIRASRQQVNVSLDALVRRQTKRTAFRPSFAVLNITVLYIPQYLINEIL